MTNNLSLKRAKLTTLWLAMKKLALLTMLKITADTPICRPIWNTRMPCNLPSTLKFAFDDLPAKIRREFDNDPLQVPYFRGEPRKRRTYGRIRPIRGGSRRFCNEANPAIGAAEEPATGADD